MNCPQPAEPEHVNWPRGDPRHVRNPIGCHQVLLLLDANRFQSVAKERRIVKQVADVMVQTVSLYMPRDSLGVELAAELEALEAMMAEEEALSQPRFV